MSLFLNWILRGTPWIITFWVGCSCLTLTGVPITEVILYSLYWLVTIVIPGTLVHRAFRRPHFSFVEDLGFGAAVGMALEIVAWFVLSVTGNQSMLRWWWLVICLIFLIVPGLRQFWCFRGMKYRVPWWWGWGVATAISFAFLMLAGETFRIVPLPPADTTVHPDMWWHLSVNHELTRTVWPQTPQVAGEPFHYHWFVNAHMAAAHIVTGINEPTILLRLWLFPIIVTYATLVSGLARQVSGSSWIGPVAVWLSIGVRTGGDFWSFYYTAGNFPIYFESPSQIFVGPLVIAAASILIDIVRNQFSRKSYILVALIVVIASGAKPTAAPLLLAGLGLAGLFLLIHEKRIPWRIITSIGIVVMASIWSFRSGPFDRVPIIFLDIIRVSSFYKFITGDRELYAVSEGIIRSSLFGIRAWLTAGLAIFWLVVSQATRVIGLMALVSSKTRQDAGAWFLSGIILAGWALSLSVAHPSFGQNYFMLTAIPFGVVLSTYLVDVVSRDAPTRTGLLSVGILGGVLIGVLARSTIDTAPAYEAIVSLRAWGISICTPVLVFIGGLFAFIWIIRQLVERWRNCQGVTLVIVIMAFLTVPFIELPDQIFGKIKLLITKTPQSKVRPDFFSFISKEDQVAALWLEKNSDQEDVVATNVHCQPLKENTDCAARAFWVSGLSGRRVLLEGWAFVPEVIAQHGFMGKHYAMQPTPWPERQKLSDNAIAEPNKKILEELRSKYGVRWLFAANRAGPISPKLQKLADLRFRNAGASIYELRDRSQETP